MAESESPLTALRGMIGRGLSRPVGQDQVASEGDKQVEPTQDAVTRPSCSWATRFVGCATT